MQSKVLKHPDREEIIRRLTDGESIRSVVGWLKTKYKNNKKHQISIPSLQEFRKKYLALEGEVLSDIQAARQDIVAEIKQQEAKALVKSNSAYQQKINSIVNSHLDIKDQLLKLHVLIIDRIEFWYNEISEGNHSATVADKELRQYIDRLMTLFQQWSKFIDGIADHTVEHNVNINMVNDQVRSINYVIMEVLEELDPEVAMVFLQKVNRKLNELGYHYSDQGVSAKELQAIEAELENV